MRAGEGVIDTVRVGSSKEEIVNTAFICGAWQQPQMQKGAQSPSTLFSFSCPWERAFSQQESFLTTSTQGEADSAATQRRRRKEAVFM